MVLTGLLYKQFRKYLLNFPNHMIHVHKEDVLNIESIEFKHENTAYFLNSSSSIDISKRVNLGKLLSSYILLNNFILVIFFINYRSNIRLE